MVFNIIQYIILFVGSLLSSYGIWRLFQGYLNKLQGQIQVQDEIKKRNRRIKDRALDTVSSTFFMNRWITRISNELDLMLQNTATRYSSSSVRSFVIFHLSLFVASYLLIFIATKGKLFSLYISLIITALNIFRHRLKLRNIRLEAGYKLAEIVGVLANIYSSQTTGKMRDALSLTNNEIKDELFIKHFTHIIRVDQNYVNVQDLKSAIDAFVYSIKTSFAIELGATIYKALRTKENVGETLVKIDSKINQNIEDIKEETATKTEVVLMSWLNVFGFPLILLGIILVFRITSEGVLYYQFQTVIGRVMFSISIAAILLGRFVTSWYVKQPNDY